jgi:hypothetical protein
MPSDFLAQAALTTVPVLARTFWRFAKKDFDGLPVGRPADVLGPHETIATAVPISRRRVNDYGSGSQATLL